MLKRHPDSLGDAAVHIEVAVERPRPDSLVLSYTVTGRMSDIRIPAVVPARRGEALWERTCFEAFVRASSGDGYYEFNFSPSTQWAAYRFSAYRSGMSVPAGLHSFAIDVQPNPGSLALRTSLALDRLPGLPHAASFSLGLSAVIEEVNGQKSYWALAHPPGKPDFHHRDCFTHEVRH
jgi:hypothetical protein